MSKLKRKRGDDTSYHDDGNDEDEEISSITSPSPKRKVN